MNRINRFLSTNGLWLPMSFFIFIVYVVQRGFATIAKSGMVPDFFPQAMSIYFTTMSVGVLAGGFLLDRFRAKDILLLACIVGSIGIILIDITPWGFGLFFGGAAAIIKARDTANDGMMIAPQSSAKNFGGAVFLLFLGAVIGGMSLFSVSVALGIAMLAAGVYTCNVMPDNKLVAWKIKDVIALMKLGTFWVLMIYFFLMCGIYYIAVSELYPGLTKVGGYSKEMAILILAASYILSGALRWPAAWLGNFFGYWSVLILGLLGMGVAIPMAATEPVSATFCFAIFSALQTPNYWPLAKQTFGRQYLATVVGLGFVFMYLGAGVMYGKW